MPSNIHNLDRDAMLMLYHAGEMNAEQHAQVDAMLARDPALRAQLDELVAAEHVMAVLMGSADAQHPLPAPQNSSVLKVSAAMAQWQVDRLAVKPSIPIRQGRRMGWLYASAAMAAMILITIFVLWSRVNDNNGPVAANEDPLSHVEQNVESNSPPADTGGNQLVADASDSYTPVAATDSDVQLTRAEGDLATLSTLTDSLRMTQDTVTP